MAVVADDRVSSLNCVFRFVVANRKHWLPSPVGGCHRFFGFSVRAFKVWNRREDVHESKAERKSTERRARSTDSGGDHSGSVRRDELTRRNIERGGKARRQTFALLDRRRSSTANERSYERGGDSYARRRMNISPWCVVCCLGSSPFGPRISLDHRFCPWRLRFTVWTIDASWKVANSDRAANKWERDSSWRNGPLLERRNWPGRICTVGRIV